MFASTDLQFCIEAEKVQWTHSSAAARSRWPNCMNGDTTLLHTFCCNVFVARGCSIRSMFCRAIWHLMTSSSLLRLRGSSCSVALGGCRPLLPLPLLTQFLFPTMLSCHCHHCCCTCSFDGAHLSFQLVTCKATKPAITCLTSKTG